MWRDRLQHLLVGSQDSVQWKQDVLNRTTAMTNSHPVPASAPSVATGRRDLLEEWRLLRNSPSFPPVHGAYITTATKDLPGRFPRPFSGPQHARPSYSDPSARLTAVLRKSLEESPIRREKCFSAAGIEALAQRRERPDIEAIIQRFRNGWGVSSETVASEMPLSSSEKRDSPCKSNTDILNGVKPSSDMELVSTCDALRASCPAGDGEDTSLASGDEYNCPAGRGEERIVGGAESSSQVHTLDAVGAVQDQSRRRPEVLVETSLPDCVVVAPGSKQQSSSSDETVELQESLPATPLGQMASTVASPAKYHSSTAPDPTQMSLQAIHQAPNADEACESVATGSDSIFDVAACLERCPRPPGGVPHAITGQLLQNSPSHMDADSCTATPLRNCDSPAPSVSPSSILSRHNSGLDPVTLSHQHCSSSAGRTDGSTRRHSSPEQASSCSHESLCGAVIDSFFGSESAPSSPRDPQPQQVNSGHSSSQGATTSEQQSAVLCAPESSESPVRALIEANSDAPLYEYHSTIDPSMSPRSDAALSTASRMHQLSPALTSSERIAELSAAETAAGPSRTDEASGNGLQVERSTSTGKYMVMSAASPVPLPKEARDCEVDGASSVEPSLNPLLHGCIGKDEIRTASDHSHISGRKCSRGCERDDSLCTCQWRGC
jgi:hypothetical protein